MKLRKQSKRHTSHSPEKNSFIYYRRRNLSRYNHGAVAEQPFRSEKSRPTDRFISFVLRLWMTQIFFRGSGQYTTVLAFHQLHRLFINMANKRGALKTRDRLCPAARRASYRYFEAVGTEERKQSSVYYAPNSSRRMQCIDSATSPKYSKFRGDKARIVCGGAFSLILIPMRRIFWKDFLKKVSLLFTLFTCKYITNINSAKLFFRYLYNNESVSFYLLNETLE